jgi:hypothetical protein
VSGTVLLALAIRSPRLIDAPMTVLNERLDPEDDVRRRLTAPQLTTLVHRRTIPTLLRWKSGKRDNRAVQKRQFERRLSQGMRWKRPAVS